MWRGDIAMRKSIGIVLTGVTCLWDAIVILFCVFMMYWGFVKTDKLYETTNATGMLLKEGVGMKGGVLTMKEVLDKWETLIPVARYIIIDCLPLTIILTGVTFFYWVVAGAPRGEIRPIHLQMPLDGNGIEPLIFGGTATPKQERTPEKKPSEIRAEKRAEKLAEKQAAAEKKEAAAEEAQRQKRLAAISSELEKYQKKSKPLIETYDKEIRKLEARLNKRRVKGTKPITEAVLKKRFAVKRPNLVKKVRYFTAEIKALLVEQASLNGEQECQPFVPADDKIVDLNTRR
jgi:hypothetical protein